MQLFAGFEFDSTYQFWSNCLASSVLAAKPL